MAQVVSNDVSAIQPELWSSMVQVPLYKSLVALEVANMRLSDTLKYADTIHVPYFGSLSVATYTPGTTLTATNQDWAFDTLVVSSFQTSETSSVARFLVARVFHIFHGSPLPS